MSNRWIRLDPHSPKGEGLEPWAVIPPDFLAGPIPVQRGVKAYEKDGLCTGTWDNLGGSTTDFRPYPLFEFMLLLEGQVTIVDVRGHQETISAGEPFFLPQGFKCAWLMPVYYRKFFMNLANDAYPSETDPAKLKVARPLPYGPPEGLQDIDLDAADFSTPKPRQRQHLAYESADARIQVGTWDATPYERPVTPSNRSELMCILEGSVTMTGPGGEETFHAGDSFFLPLGAPNGWRSEGYVRKFFCAVWP